MTIQNLIDWFDQNQYLTLGYFSVILILTIIIVFIVDQNNFKSLKYVLSAIVYAVTIPGILAAMLVLYGFAKNKYATGKHY